MRVDDDDERDVLLYVDFLSVETLLLLTVERVDDDGRVYALLLLSTGCLADDEEGRTDVLLPLPTDCRVDDGCCLTEDVLLYLLPLTVVGLAGRGLLFLTSREVDVDTRFPLDDVVLPLTLPEEGIRAVEVDLDEVERTEEGRV